MKNFNASVSRRSLLTSFAAGLGVVALGGLTACGGSSAPAGSAAADSAVLTVAASPAPHAEILTDFAAPLLAKQGIKLKVKEYTDYIQPNKDTSAGSVDANYFQHITYLEDYNAQNGTDLASAGLIHYEPFAVHAGASDDAIEAVYPVADALAHESSDSLAVERYANIICVAKGQEDSKGIKALVEVLTSEDFKAYLAENYGEDVLPAF